MVLQVPVVAVVVSVELVVATVVLQDPVQRMRVGTAGALADTVVVVAACSESEAGSAVREVVVPVSTVEVQLCSLGEEEVSSLADDIPMEDKV